MIFGFSHWGRGLKCTRKLTSKHLALGWPMEVPSDRMSHDSVQPAPKM